jgi:hypothetical protein
MRLPSMVHRFAATVRPWPADTPVLVRLRRDGVGCFWIVKATCMALRSRTLFVSMRRFAEQKALGALMVRLMMALHDFDVSQHGNQE